MHDDHFEWDDDKAAHNWRAHGVTFEVAREAFRDAFALEWEDDGQGVYGAALCHVGYSGESPTVCRLHHEGRKNSDHLDPRGPTA